MAEALGTALGLVGAVGVLGQIFSCCIKAYSLFTSATNLGRDSKRLVCKIRIEEMRLLVWGREWGVVEGELEAHLLVESQAGNERLKTLAVNILTELHWSITEKFTVLLRNLKDYNDGLESLFPPSRLATLHRTWTNELLQNAQRDLAKLSLLETASSGVYPQLNASASLKQLKINLDQPTSNFKPTFALKIQRTELEFSDRDPRRSEGTYRNP